MDCLRRVKRKKNGRFVNKCQNKGLNALKQGRIRRNTAVVDQNACTQSANADQATVESATPTPQMPHAHVNTDSYNWDEGRRIVELSVLADNLVCEECKKKTLSLKNTESEKRYGLASVLYISCECGTINAVPTGKKTTTE